MIAGIGTDMIELGRVKKACEKKHFLEKCYTDNEIQAFKDNYVALAGNFCVKEAVVKSFGTGFRGIELRQIEVLRDELGKPYVNLYDGARKMADELGVAKIYVSITNVKEYAQAFVVSEKA